MTVRESVRCPECGRRLARPSFYEPCASQHPAPDAAERLVEDIEKAVHSRRGIGWNRLDEEIVDAIRDELVRIVRKHLLGREGKA